MAGAGWRDFVAGEVLTAANVQDYLQDQAVMTFASSAARGSAIASPTEGMVSYLKDTDRLEVYTTAWTSYTAGLIPISPSSVGKAGASSTASANSLGFVTFSACESLTLEGVFSSAYRNYLVKIECATSASTEFRFRVRADGADAATNYYQGGWVIYGGGTSASQSLANQAYAYVSKGLNNTDPQVSGTIQFSNINRAVRTGWQAQFSGATDTVGDGHWLTGGAHTTTYGMTGLTIYPSSGNITGSIQVFGYQD